MSSDKATSLELRLNALIAGQLASPNTMPSMTHGWNIGGHATYVADPIGNLVVSFKDLQVGTSADTTTIWAAGSLPAAYRLPDQRRIVVYCDLHSLTGANANGAALQFETDGSITCYGIASGATRVDLFASIPMVI